MLDVAKIADIELKLNAMADVFYTSFGETKECSRGYCQGVEFVLEKLGYYIDWVQGVKISNANETYTVATAKIRKVEE